MSVKTEAIQNQSSPTVNLSLDASGNVAAGANLTVAGSATIPTMAGNPTFSGTPVFSNMPSLPGQFGIRNRIINGDMRIDQRNAGASISSGVGGLAYPCDRMFVYATGAAVTAQRTGTAGAYAITLTGAASNTLCTFGQRLESQNVADMAGSAITISATLAASTPQTIQWSITVPTTTDTYGATATIASGTFSVTATPTTYTATIAAGSTSTVVRGMQVQFAANNAGAFTSGTITLTNFQVEKSNTATPFEFRPIGTELALCQRYYQLFGGAANNMGVQGYATAAASASAYYGWPVVMRAAPTVALPTMNNINTTGLFANSPSQYGVLLAATATATGYVSSLNNAGGTGSASAEL